MTEFASMAERRRHDFNKRAQRARELAPELVECLRALCDAEQESQNPKAWQQARALLQKIEE